MQYVGLDAHLRRSTLCVLETGVARTWRGPSRGHGPRCSPSSSGSRGSRVEDVERGVNLATADDERRAEPQRALSAPQHQQPSCARLLYDPMRISESCSRVRRSPAERLPDSRTSPS